MRRLYTFNISHFSEKARWALELGGVGFEEKVVVPGLHLLTIRRIAKRSTVPVLVDGATVIQGSGAILDHAEARLGARHLTPTEPGAAARARELEALADHAFGLGIQRIVYATLLPERRAVVEMWTQDGPFYARPMMNLLYPLMARGVGRAYGVTPERVARAKDRLREAMDVMDGELRERPFLLGEAPCRADVTVAALLAPLVRPAGHVTRWPAQIPADLEAFIAEIEGRPTWELVRRMYREHRWPASVVGSGRG